MLSNIITFILSVATILVLGITVTALIVAVFFPPTNKTGTTEMTMKEGPDNA